MNNDNNRINELVDNLRRERDELKVKVHLAKMEASDEWQELEAKLEKFELNAKEAGTAAAHASKDIGSAVELLGEEIKKGFVSIAKKF
jgi:hypothetical protein